MGIRLRTEAGRKFSITGGREGLFVPRDLEDCGRLLICEGPTDLAAVLDLGFAAVGRPSCSGGAKMLVELIDVQKPAEVVIVADGDGPGSAGAIALAGCLALHHPDVKVIGPPQGVKDARAWKQIGATGRDILDAIGRSTPRRISIKVRAIAKAPAGGGLRGG